jgi:tRNA(Ile)-lysidine synthase
MVDLSNLKDLLPANTKKIAVAVSGGADSFALLHLTQIWAKKNKTALLALTVDHQLRKESTAEAKNVAAWCQKNGIAHETLNWTGAKPKTDLQNKARQARRKLLFAACKKEKISTLLMGHQADDQIETMLMRLQRGTGLKGLAGIPEIATENGITIIRPLLSERRAALRAYCKKHKLPFSDDPSNENEIFERVRVRKILAYWPELANGAANTHKRLKRADDTLSRLAYICIADNKVGEWFPHDVFLSLPEELQLRVLGKIIPDASLEHLENLQKSIISSDFKGKTLAGIWIRPKVRNRKKGLIFITAPPRKIP